MVVLNKKSGFPVTISPLFNDTVVNHVPPDPELQPRDDGPDRGTFADPEMKSLLSSATRVVDLTEAIGTVLEGVQLSKLTDSQKDELALLVSTRGVVFFRDQDLTTPQQVELFHYYGTLDRHPAQPDQEYITILGATRDFRSEAAQTPWPQGEYHSDTYAAHSYFMMLVSNYGLYDSLSSAYKRLFEGLHSVHTSRLMYETLLFALNAKPSRAPIGDDSVRLPSSCKLLLIERTRRTAYIALLKAVRTHPVTGLKALNLNPGFVTGLAELHKAESDKLLDFVWQHIHSADDYTVRFKWDANSVAMWDNRQASMV
ncbi:Taurine catabolism dioxygenase [Olea europaea subsp. europaea]|uniref:Taurine catabolism dioxygenase n=1 Tax=Olea europaea subsp. europaea TaxID=158383 RepID=A0A8S0SD03_OLEEU|nr:Taurine catabolism dioxygenase [Olea europaea subsp. europaea]